MQRFKSAEHAQRFLSSHAIIYSHFRPRRHLMGAGAYCRARDRAFRVWRQEICRPNRCLIQPSNLCATGTRCCAKQHDDALCWVDLDDVAEAAANVLTGEGDAYATYELVGIGSVLTRDEVAALMTQAWGRPVRAVRVEVDEYLARSREQPFFARLSDDEIQQIRAMFRGYDAVGCPAGNSKVLTMLLGRPATSFESFLRRLAAGAMRSAPITDYGLAAA